MSRGGRSKARRHEQEAYAEARRLAAARWVKTKTGVDERAPSKSLRTMSGGLPTLGRRR